MTKKKQDNDWFFEATRPTRRKRFWSATKYYAVGLIDRIDQHHVLLNSGGLTFSIFVCIIPLILIVFTLVGIMFNEPLVRGEIESFIDRAIPYEQYASLSKQLVLEMAREFRLHRSLSGAIGVIGLLFAASGLFSSMRTILNTAFQINGGPSVWIGKLRDFLATFAVVLVFLAVLTILPAWEAVIEIINESWLGGALQMGGLLDILINVFSFVLVFIVFGAVYTLVPSKRQSVRVTIASALVAAFFWEVAKELFGIYLSNIASFKRVYGAYAFLVVIGFWIYYTSVIFAAGAELGSLYGKRRAKKMEAKNANRFFHS